MSLEIFYPNALATDEFVLTQLEDEVSPEYNFTESSLIAPGATFPGFTSLEMKDPKVDSSTTQIKTVLDAIAAAGSEGIALALTTPSDLEWQKGRNLEGREPPTAAVHISVRANVALFYWKGITAGEKGFAKLDFVWMPTLDDNGNPPLVTSRDVALTQLPVVTELYRTGPVIMTVETPTDGVITHEICNDGWTWDNNVTLKQKKCGGETAYAYNAVKYSEPKITIPTDNLSQVLSLYEGGSIVSIDAYLRRAQQGGENVPPGTPQHIKMSSIVGTAYPVNAKTITAMLHSFTFDTASAIPV